MNDRSRAAGLPSVASPMNATPRPWERVDGEISTVAKPWAIIGWLNTEEPEWEGDGCCGCGGDWEANGDFILQAVNSYDAMREALEDAEFLLRKVGINPKEAGAMADSMKRSAADVHNLLASVAL